jgi:hypothetical protein
LRFVWTCRCCNVVGWNGAPGRSSDGQRRVQVTNATLDRCGNMSTVCFEKNDIMSAMVLSRNAFAITEHHNWSHHRCRIRSEASF